MEGHRRVCCRLLNSRKELRRASCPLHSWGPSTEGVSLPTLSTDRAGCVCLCGSGQSPATVQQPQPLVWRRCPAYAGPMIWGNAVQLLRALSFWDCPDGNSIGNMPVCSPKSLIICKTNSSLSLPPNRPPRVAAPPQHPPILIQVKAGGKWQILST